MHTSRRTLIQGSLAAAAVGTIGAPAIVRGQAAPSAARTVTAVLHGDLRVFDPIWTTANMTAYHGAMIYDTLYGIDENFDPKPQMVGKHGVSDDKLTWTFELRDGLKFSDGSAVTAADCVASLRRWQAKDGAGSHLFRRVKDLSSKDDKTFVLTLSEPYGLVLDAFAKTSTPLCVIMRKKEAETDPNEQVKTLIGSGPFLFNEGASQPGQRYIYDKNPNYVPRAEPPNGMSGGKVVKIDRVVWENISDEQTAMAALQNNEIDFYEIPPVDFLPQLESDPNITIQVLNALGNVGYCRLNHLHPPFDNVDARRAILYLLNQEDFVRATIGNPKYYRTCGSFLTCGTPLESDANTDWFKKAPDLAKAKELWAKSGYDGRPIVVLQATNIAFMNNSAQIIAEALRKLGANVELAASDWGGVVTRRSVKAPPAEGGWNVFITWGGGNATANPISLLAHAANGDKAWFGWPSNELHEKLRDEWAAATTLEARKAVTDKMQANAWDFVQHVYLGQWVQPVAYRKSLSGIVPIPEVIPFWNIEKKA